MVRFADFKVGVRQLQAEDLLFRFSVKTGFPLGNEPCAGIGQIRLFADQDFPRSLFAVCRTPAQNERTRSSPIGLDDLLADISFLQQFYSVAERRQGDDIALRLGQKCHLLAADRACQFN